MRGRKPADESQARAIRTRLLIWRQIPEAQRPSLRPLAVELGTTHQLLSFYLKRLSKWQRDEYHRKAQEIRNKGLITYADEQEALAYDQAALQCMVDDALGSVVQRIEKRAKAGNLHEHELEMVSVAARRGMPRALKIKQALAHRGIVLL